MDNQQSPPPISNKQFYIFWIAALLALSWLAQQLFDKDNNVNLNVETVITSNGGTQVVLRQGSSGHYLANGMINGYPVVFLVDTGATHVSIPENVANKIGLKKGLIAEVTTANGRANVYLTRLDAIALGDIEMQDVRASINPNTNTEEILLGMSFLKHLQMNQTGERLTLTVPE